MTVQEYIEYLQSFPPDAILATSRTGSFMDNTVDILSESEIKKMFRLKTNATDINHHSLNCSCLIVERNQVLLNL